MNLGPFSHHIVMSSWFFACFIARCRHLYMETFKFTVQDFQFQKSLAVVGFEPTPPRRLVPKTSALDRSATLPLQTFWLAIID